MKKQILCFVAATLCALLVLPAVASAQSRPLLIVPFDKEGVDQAFYDRLTGQIRGDAARSSDYEPLETAETGSMADLLFAVGCDDVDVECLQLIGESFNAEAIMWGSVWRSDRGVLLEVKLFDVLSGAYILEPPLEKSFETADDDMAFRLITGEIQQIFFPYTGEVTVTATEPSVTVLFDGQEVGSTSGGPVKLTGRPLGQHIITAVKEGREISEGVVLLFDEAVTIEIDMSKETTDGPVDGGGGGYTGTIVAGSVGGAFLVGGAIFGVLVLGVEGDVDDLGSDPKFSNGGPKRADQLRDTGTNYATIANICFGIGSAAIVLAGVLFFFEGGDDAAEETEPAANVWTPWVTPEGGVGFGLSGSF